MPYMISESCSLMYLFHLDPKITHRSLISSAAFWSTFQGLSIRAEIQLARILHTIGLNLLS